MKVSAGDQIRSVIGEKVSSSHCPLASIPTSKAYRPHELPGVTKGNFELKRGVMPAVLRLVCFDDTGFLAVRCGHIAPAEGRLLHVLRRSAAILLMLQWLFRLS